MVKKNSLCLFFSQSSSLKMHINRHENTFPHICQHCGKGFNKLSEKDKHEALHVRKVMELQIDPNTGEMAYKEKMEIVSELVINYLRISQIERCNPAFW